MADQLLSEDAFSNEKSQKLFEVIDELHTCGAKAYIDIPEIIIVGDQSAGKSSLLQSLTDIPCPVAGRLCTRFPTRIVSRRTPGGSDTTKITIEAAIQGFFSSGPTAEREQKYADFKRTGIDLSEDDFTQAVDDATRLMGISEDPEDLESKKESSKRPNFSSDVLRIELSGPKRSHFSILDVPGVFQSRTKDVTAQEMEGVKGLVSAEMRRQQSIIVCVASGTSDLATQAIFDMASKEDPQGERTLGVVTKCDVTQHADMVVSLAQNDRNGDVYFQNGWFVVRNRTPKEAVDHIDSAERHSREEKLFSGTPWNTLPSSRRGVQALKKHLGDLLCSRMQAAFPKMLADIQERRRATFDILDSLGESRSSIEQKRTYLSRIAQRFHATATAVLRGRYELINSDSMKLRKQVRDANDKFMHELKSTGHRVPFAPIPTLQHLQQAEGNGAHNASKPTGSSAFSTPPKMNGEAFTGNGNFAFTTSESSEGQSMPTVNGATNGGFPSPAGPSHTRSHSTGTGFSASTTTTPPTSLFGSGSGQTSATSTLAPSPNSMTNGPVFGSAQNTPTQASRKTANVTSGNSDEQHNAEIYQWIREEIQINRGTELQGTLNPDVLPMLFHQQANKWGGIAEKHFLTMAHSTALALNGILNNISCDNTTRTKIWPRIVEAGNARQAEKLELLRERFRNIKSRHLQTSNVAFEEKVAEARYLRFQAALDHYRISKKSSKGLFGSNQSIDSDLQFVVDMRDTAALFAELHMSNSRNLENEIHDTLKAYYEIARDDFIEYVTQHIVENFINSENGPVLMFSPLYVSSLSDEDIEDVAREDEFVIKERREKEGTLKRLEHAERIALRYA